MTAIRAPASAEIAGPSDPALRDAGTFERGHPALRPLASAVLRASPSR